jgi:hypothetical protein
MRGLSAFLARCVPLACGAPLRVLSRTRSLARSLVLVGIGFTTFLLAGCLSAIFHLLFRGWRGLRGLDVVADTLIDGLLTLIGPSGKKQ